MSDLDQPSGDARLPAPAGRVPDELRAAIIEAANILAKALPPAMQLELRIDDDSPLYYRADSDKAIALPGRRQVALRLEGRESYFSPEVAPVPIERRVDADGQVIDRDRDGVLDDVILVGLRIDHSFM